MSTGITLTQAPPQGPRDESRYSRSTEDEKGELSPDVEKGLHNGALFLGSFRSFVTWTDFLRLTLPRCRNGFTLSLARTYDTHTIETKKINKIP